MEIGPEDESAFAPSAVESGRYIDLYSDGETTISGSYIATTATQDDIFKRRVAAERARVAREFDLSPAELRAKGILDDDGRRPCSASFGQ